MPFFHIGAVAVFALPELPDCHGFEINVAMLKLSLVEAVKLAGLKDAAKREAVWSLKSIPAVPSGIVSANCLQTFYCFWA